MLRVGIIGTGIVANDHARAISLTGGAATLVAAADIVPERLQCFCDAFDVPRSYRDAAKLIADADVDLVAIATPPSAHESQVLMALNGRKHVFCEKPLAHSLASAVRIAEAEHRHPGQLSVSYQFRYDTPFRRLLWLCQNGWIGEIQSALVARHSHIPNYDHRKDTWWGSWDVAGGGVLVTQLIHELDFLLLTMGRPMSVSADMDTRYTRIESEDYVEATIHFEGGRIAQCFASVNSGYLGGGFEIKGSYGTVGLPGGFSADGRGWLSEAIRAVDRALPDTRPAYASIFSSGLARLGLRGLKNKPELTPRARLYLEIARSFENGTSLPVCANEALSSLELCMAMYESAITGSEIELPLGPKSAVYNGVLKELYDARKCSRNKWASVVFQTGNGSQKGRVMDFVVRAVKEGLAAANIEPAMITALLHKSAPVHGGPRVRRLPWPRRRHFDSRERRAVSRVMTREIRKGGAIIYGGVEEKAYCEAFAKYLGGGYADAVNSGSNAVYVALRALNLEPGSEVIVPPITDPGGTMPVALSMCIPIPADSDHGSILTSADQIRAVLSDRTSAIIVAHLGGHPVDMDPILALAAKRRIPVVEDCAQAHGAIYKGRMVGSLGTISAFSTMFGKHHTTGGQGGVVFTKDPLLFAKARQIVDRGKSYDALGNQSNQVASLNFNQDEISAAIGRVQLQKLPDFIKARRAFASLVESGLKRVEGVWLIGDPPNCLSSFWYLMVHLDSASLRCNSQEFASALLAEGIEDVNAGYSVYPTDQPWHDAGMVFAKSDLPWSLLQSKPQHFQLPNAHAANRAMVRIGIHEGLGSGDASDLVAAINKLTHYYRVLSRTFAS
jgi:perosamine synthetase